MADRITRAQIKQLFLVFCNTGGFKMSSRYDDPGLYLDYYMGYQIVEVKAGGTGQYEPLGSRRYSPKEFHAVLSFAIRVMGATRQGYMPMTNEITRSNPVGHIGRGGRRVARRAGRR